MAKILILLMLIQSINAQFVVKSYYEIRNKNVIRQQYEESCGAASIATLLNMIDIKQYRENDILKNFKKDYNNEINTNMVSFAELQEVLSKFGYHAKGYQISKDVLELIEIPIIVKIEDDPRFPHFVVILNHSGDFLSIYDPSFGEYISVKNNFYRLWDKRKKGGYVLIVEPKIKRIIEFKLPTTNLIQK